MLLKGRSYKPGASWLTLVDGATDTGYTIIGSPDWGTVVRKAIFSGQRGSQGARAVGAEYENRVPAVSLRIRGTSKDDMLAKLSALHELADEWLRFGGQVKRQLNGQSYPDYFEVLASDGAKVNEWTRRSEHSNFLDVTLVWTAEPLLRWDPMDVRDDFSSDRVSGSAGEYTFDAGAAADVAVDLNADNLDAVANLTTEKRLIHTAYGYSYADHQVTVRPTPGSTITGFKAGVILKRTAANTYIEVYVDDNGTNSRLRIDAVTNGTPVNKFSINLGARVAAGTSFWLRGRVERETVFAEYFTTASFPSGPDPFTAGTSSGSWTMGGGDPITFGEGVVGKAGMTWTPQHTNAKLDDFELNAYWHKAVTLPAQLDFDGPIPGDAPALADISVTGGGIWALLAWLARGPTIDPSTTGPFGLVQAESATGLVLWASAADANYFGGNGLKRTTAGAEDLSADLARTPYALLVPPDYQRDTFDVEVWARVELASTLVGPKLTLSAIPTSYGSTIYTSEYGTAGKLLVKPSAGTHFRFVRLGVLTLAVDGAWNFRVAGRVEAGSSGQFGLDYLLVCPADARALGPTGKPNDASYPKFKVGGGNVTRTIRADLSGLGGLGFPGGPALELAPGLGGSLIELQPENLSLLAKLSSLVPDDPTSDTTSETLPVSATISVSVTPRSRGPRAG